MNTPTPQDSLFSPDGLNEAAKLRDELKQMHAEHSALNDRYMRLLKEQSERAQRARAAAEQQARDTALDLISAALRDTLAEAVQIARAVQALPERPAPSALLELRTMADNLADWDVNAHPDVAAVRAIEQQAQAQIDHWRDRAATYWNRTQRSREELLAAEDTYIDLVSAGWKPPDWRLAQHRAAVAAEHAAPSGNVSYEVGT